MSYTKHMILAGPARHGTCQPHSPDQELSWQLQLHWAWRQAEAGHRQGQTAVAAAAAESQGQAARLVGQPVCCWTCRPL